MQSFRRICRVYKKIEWFGHFETMSDERMAKTIYEGKRGRTQLTLEIQYQRYWRTVTFKAWGSPWFIRDRSEGTYEEVRLGLQKSFIVSSVQRRLNVLNAKLTPIPTFRPVFKTLRMKWRNTTPSLVLSGIIQYQILTSRSDENENNF